MARIAPLFALLAINLTLVGCGAIHTAPLPSSTVHLTPNPPIIYVAPFQRDKTRWLIGQNNSRDGFDQSNFKQDFQSNFTHQLTDRLNKIAPSEIRWKDDLPDHGWLVEGEFVAVDQGSRALRTVVGAGLGQTTLETNVYVYDLSVSKTEYLLAFRTGVPDEKNETGAGSGSIPAGISTLGEPITTLSGLGSGLNLDTTRTCREIATILEGYL